MLKVEDIPFTNIDEIRAKLMERVDADHDEKISFDEFVILYEG